MSRDEAWLLALAVILAGFIALLVYISRGH